MTVFSRTLRILRVSSSLTHTLVLTHFGAIDKDQKSDERARSNQAPRKILRQTDYLSASKLASQLHAMQSEHMSYPCSLECITWPVARCNRHHRHFFPPICASQVPKAFRDNLLEINLGNSCMRTRASTHLGPACSELITR